MNKYGFVKLTKVEPHPDYTLTLTFETGETKKYDFKQKLQQKLFMPLQDVSLFMKAKNDGYGVVWDERIDIASEFLYYNGTPVTQACA